MNGGPIEMNLKVNGRPITMEVDTGASLSIMSKDCSRRLYPTGKLNDTAVSLNTYTRETVKVVGVTDVTVEYEDQTFLLQLHIVEGSGRPSLFGRDWLEHIRLNWSSLHQIHTGRLTDLLNEHSEVFADELGTLKGRKVKITVHPKVTPKFCKARAVPYAMKEKVEMN